MLISHLPREVAGALLTPGLTNMRLILGVFFAALSAVAADAPPVTGIAAIHHNGQTFVTWTDAATGADGANYRYKVYRSTSPITDAASLAAGTLIQDGIFNNSGQRAAQYPFTQATRQDGTKLMSIIQQGACGTPPATACGTALSAFAGLAVHTATGTGAAYYAVITHDRTGAVTDSPVSAGNNAMTFPVSESAGTRVPLKYYDSADATHRTSTGSSITGTGNLPLWFKLHASGGCGNAITVGDLWQFWGDSTMGYQEGVQNAFSVFEDHGSSLFGQKTLIAVTCDTAWTSDGLGQLETNWFGYLAVPLGSSDPAPRAQPTTEAQLNWLIDWAVSHYGADRNKIYGWGQSMGGWGTSTWTVRHPEIFAAVFPEMPRWRMLKVADMASKNSAVTATISTLMPDQTTAYLDRMDTVAYIQSRCGQYVPFIGWGIGRQDGYATWQEQVDMVNALKACRLGFAFNWNNGTHPDGPAAAAVIRTQYQTRFTKDSSYPAFTNSSIDSNPGNGDPADGDLAGCINCGFNWTAVAEVATTWSTAVSNSNNVAPMTVDITPRNAQLFQPGAGKAVTWTASTGQSGAAVTNSHGLVTAPGVTINAGAPTTITFVAATGDAPASLSGQVVISGNTRAQ